MDARIQTLAIVPPWVASLRSGLGSLVRSFEANSGVHVILEVGASPYPLPPRVEQGLRPMVENALTHAWRHGRSSIARVRLDFHPSCTLLTIIDDGVALTHRRQASGLEGAIENVRRAVGELGGTVHLRSSRPRGVIVQVRIPTRAE